MSYYSCYSICNITEYFGIVDSITTTTTNTIWFRGVGSTKFKLSPSIMRHCEISDHKSMEKMEDRLLIRFKERSLPYLKDRIEDDWQLLFLMQHYGIPTRFLDWTENPAIALFFALSSAKKNNGTYMEDAAVWLLDPYKWNKHVFHHVGWDDGPMSISNDYIKNGYSPGRINNRSAVAVYGIHNSPRIVAQRGSFSILGTDTNSLDEQFYKDNNFDNTTIQKIIIEKSNIERLLKKLISMGITDATIYPDLVGLGLEIKRVHGYEV